MFRAHLQERLMVYPTLAEEVWLGLNFVNAACPTAPSVLFEEPGSGLQQASRLSVTGGRDWPARPGLPVYKGRSIWDWQPSVT